MTKIMQANTVAAQRVSRLSQHPVLVGFLFLNFQFSVIFFVDY